MQAVTSRAAAKQDQVNVTSVTHSSMSGRYDFYV
jgi:hypothetical protein